MNNEEGDVEMGFADANQHPDCNCHHDGSNLVYWDLERSGTTAMVVPLLNFVYISFTICSISSTIRILFSAKVHIKNEKT